MVADGVIFGQSPVEVMRDVLLQQAGKRARHGVRRGHLDPGQKEEQAAEATKKGALHVQETYGGGGG